MSKVYWSIIGFSLLVILFSFTYYFSFKSAHVDHQKNGTNQAQTQMAGDSEDVNGGSKVIDANQSDAIRTDSNTTYVEESYDIADAIYNNKQSAIPQEYVGLTRVDIQNKLMEYMNHPPKEEVKKGLVSITLSSFSKASITIRKVFDNKDNYAYYMTEYGGYVVVYTNDKKTIVDQTGILVTDLTKEEQNEVRKGVYIDDLDQLYGILESYSS